MTLLCVSLEAVKEACPVTLRSLAFTLMAIEVGWDPMKQTAAADSHLQPVCCLHGSMMVSINTPVGFVPLFEDSSFLSRSGGVKGLTGSGAMNFGVSLE